MEGIAIGKPHQRVKKHHDSKADTMELAPEVWHLLIQSLDDFKQHTQGDMEITIFGNVPYDLFIVASRYRTLVNEIASEYRLRIRVVDRWSRLDGWKVNGGTCGVAGKNEAPVQLFYLMCKNSSNYYLVFAYHQLMGRFGNFYCAIVDANRKSIVCEPEAADKGLILTYVFYLDLLNNFSPNVVRIFPPSDDSLFYDVPCYRIWAWISRKEESLDIPIATPHGVLCISPHRWCDIQARSLYDAILTK